MTSRQQNAIRHLLPLSDLIAMTVAGEFRIYSDGAPAVTPTSLTVKPQGYSGASNVQPALTNGSILYVQSQGSRVREMAAELGLRVAANRLHRSLVLRGRAVRP